jgi:hypothetical protein
MLLMLTLSGYVHIINAEALDGEVFDVPTDVEPDVDFQRVAM